MVHPKAMARPDIKGEMRQKLQNIKNRMMQYCYNKNCSKYKNYGGRGVTVDKKWHRIKGFLEDFDKIDGWDEEKFMAGKLQLDKDIKDRNNKIYNKEMCSWVSPEENIKVKPSYQREYVGVRYDGTREHFHNCVEFSKKYPEVHSCTIPGVANGDRSYTTGWYFFYKGEEPKPPMVYKATKEGEDPIVSFRQTDVERAISSRTPSGYIHKVMKGERKNKSIEGWEISWYLLPC